MIDQSGMGPLAALRRGLCALIFGLLGATGALADAWEAFETRCLAPMEALGTIDLDGLEQSAISEGIETWKPAVGDWELRRPVVQTERSQYCEISGNYDVLRALDWVTQSRATERYASLPSQSASVLYRLQSTQWREPRIEVWVGRLMNRGQLVVLETNVES